MNQKYELMIIISSNITEEAIQKSLKEVKSHLGSEVVFEELWGMRPFAYPIKKQDKGYYVVWNFMGNSETSDNIEEALKHMPEVLRHLLIKVPADYTPISLEQVEAELEELREEKAEKRGKTKNALQRRKEKEKEGDDEKPATKAAPKTEEKPATEKEEAPKEDKKDDKSLDQKLDDILSDSDLGL